MTCVPAPACRAVLDQATALWPLRSRLADGICASSAHHADNPRSDHEVGEAADLTHDPAHGCDAHAWAESLVARRDRRVKYVISRGRIAASYPVGTTPAWTWRPYSGPNPHNHHAHLSITHAARNDTAPWFDHPEDDDMAFTAEQAEKIANGIDTIKNFVDEFVPRLTVALETIAASAGGGGDVPAPPT